MVGMLPQSETRRFNSLQNAGDLRLQQQKCAQAEADYTSALAVNPWSDECYYGRAQARSQQARRNEALQDMDQAVNRRLHCYPYLKYRHDIQDYLEAQRAGSTTMPAPEAIPMPSPRAKPGNRTP